MQLNLKMLLACNFIIFSFFGCENIQNQDTEKLSVSSDTEKVAMTRVPPVDQVWSEEVYQRFPNALIFHSDMKYSYDMAGNLKWMLQDRFHFVMAEERIKKLRMTYKIRPIVIVVPNPQKYRLTGFPNVWYVDRDLYRLPSSRQSWPNNDSITGSIYDFKEAR